MARCITEATDYLSVREAADRCDLSEKTIRRYIAAGKLPAFRVGPRNVRIRVGDLDAFARPIPTS